MSANHAETDITVRDQMKKFALKSTMGFQTVITYGLGTRVGIFEYLHKKGQSLSDAGPIDYVLFTPEELIENLDLDSRYLDAWLHMALECGIFEIDDKSKRTLRTSPHVYNILVDRHNMFYLGGTLNTFYLISPYQNQMAENFKTGKIETYFSLPPEHIRLGQSICVVASTRVEEIYSKSFKEHRKKLRHGGFILEVGCGYGFNLELWAHKYKRARIVGIDIDPNGVEYTKNIITENGWNNRTEALKISIHEYAESNKEKFDLILMNHVLHEMDPDEEFRQKVFVDLYTLLKEGGFVIVVEHMISDLFGSRDRLLFFEIWHKFYEVGLNSKFYDKKSFREFIARTPFKVIEFIEDRNDYFWVLKK